MTIVIVTTLQDRLSLDQRRNLSQSLTDAVLQPELGRLNAAARIGFQVQFVERSKDTVALGGVLVADMKVAPDLIHVDVAVMDGAWPAETRRQVIENVLGALSKTCGNATPSSARWVTLRVIEDGSWGMNNRVLAILDLVKAGWFSPERAAEIRAAQGV